MLAGVETPHLEKAGARKHLAGCPCVVASASVAVFLLAGCGVFVLPVASDQYFAVSWRLRVCGVFAGVFGVSIVFFYSVLRF